MSVFILKTIAIFCMLFDHLRHVSPLLNNDYTRIIGRIAFPIFAFLLAEGCIHTKNKKKYLERLFVFSILSEIPYLMFMWGCKVTNEFELNVICTLFCSACTIFIDQKTDNIFLKLVNLAFFSALAELTKMDYGYKGVLLVYIFYKFKDKDLLKYLLFLIIFYFDLIKQCQYNILVCVLNWSFFAGYTVSTIFLFFYNGEIGKFKFKYFFYLFYPIHFIILYGIYKYIH